MREYVIAKYMRLSLDDAKTGSMSLENQSIIMNKHISTLEENSIKVIEFEDNGYSGTNFERPGIQEILRLVRTGGVDCVIVKDFSRFGRNSLEVGYFIEQVFPLFRTRFISVSEGYDSNDYKEDTGGLNVAINFLIHEYYSRDLSKKIRSSRLEKMKCGEYQTKNCAFGYIKGADGRLAIDEPAAKTVRLIFTLASEGKSLRVIAEQLYQEQRSTPGEYKNMPKRVKQEAGEAFQCLWTSGMLTKILADEQYIGTYVAGKTRIVEVGSKKAVKVDEAEWVKIPDHHPAIIDKATFDKVRELRKREQTADYIKKRSISNETKYESILSGKVFCGCCGYAMHRSVTKNVTFHCRHTIAALDAKCHCLKITESELNEELSETIRKQAQAILNIDLTEDIQAKDILLAEQVDLNTRIAERTEQKRLLYERLIQNEIDAESYAKQKALVSSETRRLQRELSVLSERAVELINKNNSCAAMQEAIKSSASELGLNRSVIELLVDRVYVYPETHVEIAWKVADFTQQ